MKHGEAEAYSWVAKVVWLVSGAYLFIATPNVSIFSLVALGYFTIGTFAASIILGNGYYLIQRFIAAALARVHSWIEDTFSCSMFGFTTATATIIGLIVVVIVPITTFMIARWVFQHIT